MKTGKNLRSIFNYNHKKWSVSDISKIIYDYTDVEVLYSKTMFFFTESPFGDIQIKILRLYRKR